MRLDLNGWLGIGWVEGWKCVGKGWVVVGGWDMIVWRGCGRWIIGEDDGYGEMYMFGNCSIRIYFLIRI